MIPLDQRHPLVRERLEVLQRCQVLGLGTTILVEAVGRGVLEEGLAGVRQVSPRKDVRCCIFLNEHNLLGKRDSFAVESGQLVNWLQDEFL